MSSTTRRLQRAGAAAADPDQELLERARRYEPEALAEAFDRNFDRIYAFVFAGLGDEDRAEEMTAQVFVKALDVLAGGDSQAAPGMTVFLLRLAVAELGRHLRARVAHLDGAGGQETGQSVRRAIGRLGDAQMKVIMLRFFAGMDSQEIADVTGYRPARVQALQHNGLKSLQRYFAEPQVTR